MFYLLALLSQAPALAGTPSETPQAPQTPLDRWWGGIVEQWLKETGLPTGGYSVVLNIRLKADREVGAVLIRSSTVSSADTDQLIAIINASGKVPIGTPLDFDLAVGDGKVEGGGLPMMESAESNPSVPEAEKGETASVPVAPASEPLPTAPAVDPRDAEMFGSSEPVPPSAEPENRDAEMFGETDRDSSQLGSNSAATESAFGRLVSEADNRLSLGGRLYLRLNSNWPEGTSWDSSTLTAPNLLDLYADYRPDDHVRAYVDGRLSYDYTVQPGTTDLAGNEVKSTTAELDEFWLKFDVKNRLFVTAGLQHLRWGTGRIWNPTDFLNPTPKDPLAVFDARTGVPLVKLHVPFEKLGANLYGVVDLSEPVGLDYVGGALRAEIAAGPGEYSVSVAARKDQPFRLGADASVALWIFDVKGEFALLHNDPGPYYKGEFDLETFTFPKEVDRKEDWIPQVDIGLEVPIKYSDTDTLTLGAEYFHNDAGYEDTSILPYLYLQGGYKPLYLGRDYVAAYALLLGPGNWDSTSFILTGISNLTDQTYTTRFQMGSQIRTWISWDFSVGYSFGKQGEFHQSLVVPAIPGVLPDGLEVPAQQLSFALGAQVKF